ncbi:MAG: AAA family ATPase [Planctomycetaceae bacterium]
MPHDPWAPRDDGLSSIDIPEAPPGFHDPPDLSAADRSSDLPPGHQLGPNIHSGVSFGRNAGRPENASRESPEYAVIQDLPRIEPTPVDWLWPGRIPLGKLTLLVGDAGVGKSLLTLDMAARISRGRPWPDAPQTPQKRGHVLILAAEDTPHDTLVPRLHVLKADISQVEAVAGLQGSDRSGWRERKWRRPIVLPDDIGLLDVLVGPRYEKPSIRSSYAPDGSRKDESVFPENGRFPPTRLIIIDPLAAYFARANGNDNVQVRRLLQPLVEFAAHYNVAIVGITHLNKSTSQPGRYRTLGSQAFTAVARAVWGVAHSPGDPARRRLLPIKNNLGPPPSGLAFRLGDNALAWETEPIADDWGDTLDRRAEDEAERGWSTKDAMNWLDELLQDGEFPAQNIRKLADDNLISKIMLKRAKARLKVKSRKEGFHKNARWIWSLPK